MPVLIKTSEMQYKDNLGNYHGVNAIAEKKIADQIADLDVAITAQEARMDADVDQMSDEITEQEARIAADLAAGDSAIDGIDNQRNTMIAAIASVAGQGTDNTLTQQGVAADAQATGKLIAIQSSEPSGYSTKLWVNENAVDEYTVPTATEHNALDVNRMQDDVAVLHMAVQSQATPFSTSATYNVGDYVLRDLSAYHGPMPGESGNGYTEFSSAIYRCHTAVATAGEWTGDTNWTVVKVMDEVSELKSAISSIAFVNKITANNFRNNNYQNSIIANPAERTLECSGYSSTANAETFAFTRRESGYLFTFEQGKKYFVYASVAFGSDQTANLSGSAVGIACANDSAPSNNFDISNLVKVQENIGKTITLYGEVAAQSTKTGYLRLVFYGMGTSSVTYSFLLNKVLLIEIPSGFETDYLVNIIQTFNNPITAIINAQYAQNAKNAQYAQNATVMFNQLAKHIQNAFSENDYTFPHTVNKNVTGNTQTIWLRDSGNYYVNLDPGVYLVYGKVKYGSEYGGNQYSQLKAVIYSNSYNNDAVYYKRYNPRTAGTQTFFTGEVYNLDTSNSWAVAFIVSGFGETEAKLDVTIYDMGILKFESVDEASAFLDKISPSYDDESLDLKDGFTTLIADPIADIQKDIEEISEQLPLYDTDLLFWGDSLTAGAGGSGTSYPAVCANELGKTYLNCGVGGETANTIAARQGGNSIIIPAGSVNGDYPISTGLEDVFGGVVQPLLQGNGAGSASKISVNGVECNIANSNGNYVISGYTGSALTIPAFARFAGSEYTGKIVVMFVGSNGATVSGTSTGLEARIAIIRSMIKHIGHNRFVVLGLSIGNNDSFYVNDDDTMLAEFGNQYFPTRKMLVEYGLTLAGITPSAQDLTDISAGTVPSSLRSDNVHLNAAGYTVLGKMVADKIRSLGYV